VSSNRYRYDVLRVPKCQVRLTWTYRNSGWFSLDFFSALRNYIQWPTQNVTLLMHNVYHIGIGVENPFTNANAFFKIKCPWALAVSFILCTFVRTVRTIEPMYLNGPSIALSWTKVNTAFYHLAAYSYDFPKDYPTYILYTKCFPVWFSRKHRSSKFHHPKH